MLRPLLSLWNGSHWGRKTKSQNDFYKSSIFDWVCRRRILKLQKCCESVGTTIIYTITRICGKLLCAKAKKQKKKKKACVFDISDAWRSGSSSRSSGQRKWDFSTPWQGRSFNRTSHLFNRNWTCCPSSWHYHWFGLLPGELLPGVSADGRGGGLQEHWAASSAGLWFSSVVFCSVFLLAGQTNPLRRAPSTLPLRYFYFYQRMMIWSKVILIFCLKRLQLNIHSSWGGLLCSVFGICVTETKGCKFIFKEIGHHYRELNNLFQRSAELWVKHLSLNCDFFFSPWILKQNKNSSLIQLIHCNSKFNWEASPRLFCSVRHIQHEFNCS